MSSDTLDKSSPRGAGQAGPGPPKGTRGEAVYCEEESLAGRWEGGLINRKSRPIGKASRSCLRPAGGPILRRSRLESTRNPTRKPEFLPGVTTA